MDEFSAKFYHTFKELTSIFFKLFNKIKEKGMLPYSYYKASITQIPKLDKDISRKENFMPLSLKNNDAKILNKILAHCIQNHIKIIVN